MRYYHSGINSYALVELLAEEGLAGMVNARCALQPAMQRAYEDFPEVPLALDSGAFQGQPGGGDWDAESYAEVLREVGQRFEWHASLDVIGAQHASDLRYAALTRLYYFNVLWIYQLGDRPPTHVERVFSEGIVEEGTSFIGVGGAVTYGSRHGQGALMRRIEGVGEVLERLGLQAHFFGVGSPRLLQSFAGAPWLASADSAKFLAGLKGRLLYRLDGSRVRAEEAGLALGKWACARNNLRQIERWARGAGAPWSAGETGGLPLFDRAAADTGATWGASHPARSVPALRGRCRESFLEERGGPAQRGEGAALSPVPSYPNDPEPFAHW